MSRELARFGLGYVTIRPSRLPDDHFRDFALPAGGEIVSMADLSEEATLPKVTPESGPSSKLPPNDSTN